jgi:cysteinyl-tRNA synthetase
MIGDGGTDLMRPHHECVAAQEAPGNVVLAVTVR